MAGQGGFAFDLCKRNEFLEARGAKHPGFTKTGTTIAGIIYKDGVVLGADTRSTAGTTVADKNCEKIHYIAPNIYCCGAGTAADTENVTGMVASQARTRGVGAAEQNARSCSAGMNQQGAVTRSQMQRTQQCFRFGSVVLHPTSSVSSQ
jgi:20S proteasome alpha/beta subunit